MRTLVLGVRRFKRREQGRIELVEERKTITVYMMNDLWAHGRLDTVTSWVLSWMKAKCGPDPCDRLPYVILQKLSTSSTNPNATLLVVAS